MKKFRALIALTLIAAMALSATACSKKKVSVKEVTADEFIDALEEMGIKKNKDQYYYYDLDEKQYHEYTSKELKNEGYSDYEEYIEARGKDSDTRYTYIIYEDESLAHEQFENIYRIYDDLDNFDGWDGNCTAKFDNGDQGYVIAYVDYDDKESYDQYLAVYYNGNMIVTARAYTVDGKLKDKYCEEVAEFLDILGYDAADIG